MRHIITSSDFREGFAGMLPACVGLIPFGLVTGVGAATAGANFFSALGMSAIIFSGAAQILATQLLAAGAPLGVVVLTCFVAGLRFLMYSAAMAPYLKPLPPPWQNALAFLLTDQAFAAAIGRLDNADDPRAGALYFLGGGIALWGGWQVTNTVGFMVGNLVPAAWSLDFAVPLCFIALIAPLLRGMPALVAAGSAGFFVSMPTFASLLSPRVIAALVAGVIGFFTRNTLATVVVGMGTLWLLQAMPG